MRWLASTFAMVAFFAALQLVAPPDGFFSGDQGAKYLQARAFALQGPLDPGIGVASRDVDPLLEHQVLENRGGRLVGVFSWLLPMLTAPFFSLLGFRGLYVVPALSAVIILFAAACLGRGLTEGAELWTAWVVVLCAPVLVYGGELWEHAPAAACVAIAACLLAPDSHRVAGAALAGAVIGVAGLFREEAVVALPALLVARVLTTPSAQRWKDGVRIGAIAAAGALTVFVFAIPVNVIVYGSPLPLHLAVETAKVNAHPPSRLSLIADYLLPDRAPVVFVAAAAAAALSVFRYRTTRAKGWLNLAVASAGVMLLISVLVPMWRLIVFGDPPSPKYFERLNAPHAYSVDSIAHTWAFAIPLVFLPLLAVEPERRRAIRYLAVAAVLILIGTLWIVPSIGGAQWSPRYLFVSAPLFAALAAATAVRPLKTATPRIVTLTARAALLCAFAMQVDGLRYLALAKARNARITHRLAELTQPGDVVITDIAWFAQVTAELSPSRRILFAWSPQQVESLARMAAAKGMRTIGIAASMPETGFAAPRTIDAIAEGCLFTRTAREDLRERGLILHRYQCTASVAALRDPAPIGSEQ